jgi:transcriptional regulator with XRE-family HTH domain
MLSYRTMTKGRRVNLDTKIGRLMFGRNLRAYELCGACNFSPRVLTEYLSQRQPISEKNLKSLCEFFNVPPEDIVEDHWFANASQIKSQPDPSSIPPPAVPTPLVKLQRKHKAEMETG